MEHPSSILMVRPHRFGYNTQTAEDNHYQTAQPRSRGVGRRAQREFDAFADELLAADIDVTIVQDTPLPHTPDSLFPNNWFSTHRTGDVIVYPMKASNRRHEVNKDVIPTLIDTFQITSITDYSHHAAHGIHLEGTGSIVFDHAHHIAYAAYSHRTDPQLLERVVDQLNYTAIGFDASDESGQAIYHTNVMMAVADTYAVVCLDALRRESDYFRLRDTLHDTDKEIIEVTQAQVRHFAGNMLQVWDRSGNPHLVMSQQAHDSLYLDQIDALERFNPIISPSIPTIEKLGGGSVRCMMAEINLDRR